MAFVIMTRLSCYVLLLQSSIVRGVHTYMDVLACARTSGTLSGFRIV